MMEIVEAVKLAPHPTFSNTPPFPQGKGLVTFNSFRDQTAGHSKCQASLSLFS